MNKKETGNKYKKYKNYSQESSRQQKTNCQSLVVLYSFYFFIYSLAMQSGIFSLPQLK